MHRAAPRPSRRDRRRSDRRHRRRRGPRSQGKARSTASELHDQKYDLPPRILGVPAGIEADEQTLTGGIDDDVVRPAECETELVAYHASELHYHRLVARLGIDCDHRCTLFGGITMSAGDVEQPVPLRMQRE